ncbi:endonuclease/exonuclease/phosphatase family protein [Streptomyces sp. NPDC051452]|uniref:endonuclease/exonuclease/phosphatase family protein n=1 Tax=Streptomyces sp. NPDC051452 TaxID=3365654 RepID=UPI0037A3810A
MFPTRSESAVRAGGWRRRGRAAAVGALLGLAAALTWSLMSGQAPSSATGRTLTVATWNMCGVERWNCEGTGSPAVKRRALSDLVARTGARVVFLQESCAGDVRAVSARLGASWHSAFHAYTWRTAAGRTSTVRCAGAGQGAAGTALLSAYDLSAVAPVAAQQPTVGLRRGILCATVAALDVRLCVAHLSPPGSDRAHPRWELRDDQLRALVSAVPARRTVFGGDLNVDPPAAHNPAAWVWPAEPYHAYEECDQPSASSLYGRPTHRSRHKIDYLFTGLPRAGCSVRDTGASDHYALVLRVRTR